MKADSDAYGSQGGGQEYTELISPIIDCSMYPNVFFNLNNNLEDGKLTHVVMTSIDGGVTWTGKHYINSTIDANEIGLLQLISLELIILI